MLRAGLSGFHDELVQSFRFVPHVLTVAKALDRQPNGFVQRPSLQIDGMLNTFGIPERHAALLHAKRIPLFAFSSLWFGLARPTMPPGR